MATPVTPHHAAGSIAHSFENIDPHSYLHANMRAIGEGGKALGKVASLEHDPTTGNLTSLTIRHGLFTHKLTTVPADKVKWVNQDSVVLKLSPTTFKKLDATDLH